MVAHVRGCKGTRSNAVRGKERLDGLIPVAEDWHTKMCLMGDDINKPAFQKLYYILFIGDMETFVLNWKEAIWYSYGT